MPLARASEPWAEGLFALRKAGSSVPMWLSADGETVCQTAIQSATLPASSIDGAAGNVLPEIPDLTWHI